MMHIPLLILLVIQAVKPSYAFVIDFTLLSSPLRVIVLQRNRIISGRKALPAFALVSVAIPVTTSILMDSYYDIEPYLALYYLINLFVAFLPLGIIIRFFLKNYTNPSLLPDIRNLKRILRNAFLFIAWCAIIPQIAVYCSSRGLWLWTVLFIIIFSFTEFRSMKKLQQQMPVPYSRMSETLIPLVEDHAGGNLIESLDKFLVKDKGCLNKKLTEKELAARLGTNRCYLSRTVNSRLGYSLPLYINRCRIYFACLMMIENPDYTNNYISECCGFVVSSTFNNSFKRVTGKTPYIWRREAMIVKANTGKYELDKVFKELDEKVLQQHRRQC